MRSNLSVINVYKKKSIKSKLLSTQLLYGDSFKIIKKKGSWLKIRNNSDGYKGFIKKKNFSSDKRNTHKVKRLFANLYTKNIPDPEILIRTGNRNRLSNFLLWQSSYTEIFFLSKLWPEFTKNDFTKIITKFSRVRRNFGAVNG